MLYLLVAQAVWHRATALEDSKEKDSKECRYNLLHFVKQWKFCTRREVCVQQMNATEMYVHYFMLSHPTPKTYITQFIRPCKALFLQLRLLHTSGNIS